ncbi:unnamed protein product [Cunninghamella echinulata]
MSAVKLGTLAKPVANSIKTQAKQHPAFRDFCIGVAQVNNNTIYNKTILLMMNK